MMADSTSNPFEAPRSPVDVVVTTRNRTPIQCLFFFFLAGGLSGLLSGPVAIVFLAMYPFAGAILLVPGLLFGGAFWITAHYCIGALTSLRMIILIGGCLVGFVITGTVFDAVSRSGTFFGPPWTWETLRPCLAGPAAGLLLMTSVVRVFGGAVRWRVLATVWTVGTLLGFMSFFGFHELESYAVDRSLTLLVSLTFFQSTLLGLIGWQLASARAVVRAADI